MRNEVQLIVTIGGSELVPTSAGGYGDWSENIVSPYPFIPFSPAQDFITVGTEIILGDTSSPTYTPFATLVVTSVDYGTNIWSFTVISGSIPAPGTFCWWFVFTNVGTTTETLLDLYEYDICFGEMDFRTSDKRK